MAKKKAKKKAAPKKKAQKKAKKKAAPKKKAQKNPCSEQQFFEHIAEKGYAKQYFPTQPLKYGYKAVFFGHGRRSYAIQCDLTPDEKKLVAQCCGVFFNKTKIGAFLKDQFKVAYSESENYSWDQILALMGRHVEREPEDLAAVGVILQIFDVDRSTLSRFRKDGKIKGWRSPAAGKTAPYYYSISEVHRHWPKLTEVLVANQKSTRKSTNSGQKSGVHSECARIKS